MRPKTRWASDGSTPVDPTPLKPGDLLTVREAAELLRVKPVTIFRMIARGELPHWRVSNAIRINRVSVQALASLDASSRSR